MVKTRVSASAFPTTHWTLVLSAATSGSGPHAPADRALADLCQAYWKPLYTFVRRRGHSADEAQDLTQEFFALLLEKRYLTRADPSKGRFRSFLLVAMKHFLANEHDRRQAQKRGGQIAVLPIPFHEVDDVWEPQDHETPEKIFDREWALTLLARVTGQLRETFVRDGRADDFDRLKPFLPGRESNLSYADAARLLGTSEGAAKVAVHRLRRRYRDVLHAEIAHTVEDSGEVENEIRYLLQALAS